MPDAVFHKRIRRAAEIQDFLYWTLQSQKLASVEQFLSASQCLGTLWCRILRIIGQAVTSVQR